MTSTFSLPQHRQVPGGRLERIDRVRTRSSLSRAMPSSADRHRPMKPTFSDPNCRTRYGARRQSAGRSRVSTTFETTQVNRGLRHPLEQDVDAEVELVVAERGDVEPGGVERRDHLLAFEDGRRDRRGQEVAGQKHQRRRGRLRQLLFERGDAREAAEAVDGHGGVDVVELEDRERRRRRAAHRVVLRAGRSRLIADGTRSPATATRNARRAMRCSSHAVHLREVDVAAAQDDADPLPAERPAPLEQRGRAQRAGRLDDELQPLPQVEHRPQQRGVVDRHHVGDERSTSGKVSVPSDGVRAPSATVSGCRRVCSCFVRNDRVASSPAAGSTPMTRQPGDSAARRRAPSPRAGRRRRRGRAADRAARPLRTAPRRGALAGDDVRVIEGRDRGSARARAASRGRSLRDPRASRS